jgi:hypothetical protein
MFADPIEKNSVIMRIPLKVKVEVLDEKKYYLPSNKNKDDNLRLSKIKYKDTIGYVFSGNLSERSDIPFVDNVKFNYKLNEFKYNREKAINWAKKQMIEIEKIKEPLSDEYYIDDPMIYSFVGESCDGKYIEKYILVIMISKLHRYFNLYVIINVDNKNEYSYGGGGRHSFTKDDSSEEVKGFIKGIKGGSFCP